MPSPSDDIARAAAQRLSGEFGPRLPEAVEALLQSGAAPQQFGDPATLAIAFASPVIAAASLAYAMLRDGQKDAQAPPASAILERRVRIELQLDPRLAPEARDRIIAIVVEEALKTPGV